MGLNLMLHDIITPPTMVRDRWLRHVVFLAPAVPSLHLSSRLQHPEPITLTQLFESTR
jgi:hypothetical protein